MVIITEACKAILIEIKEVKFGNSKLTVNGLIIRMLGYKGEEYLISITRPQALYKILLRKKRNYKSWILEELSKKYLLNK